MKMIIAVPFFNTAGNHRHRCVVRTLSVLKRQVAASPVETIVVAVDNGSTDLRCWEWLHSLEGVGILALRIETPMSISQGVNTAWRPWEKEFERGKAIPVKFDSDMIADASWPKRLHAAVGANEAELWHENQPLGMVGLRVQRHPNPPPDDAPRGPGGIVQIGFLHGACTARTPIGFRCIGYEKHPFLPELLPSGADMSLPWGRWGFGDHWTQQRLNFTELYTAILPDVIVAGHFGSGSISRQHKQKILPVARRSLEKMGDMLSDGEIGPYQEFDGDEDPMYGPGWDNTSYWRAREGR